MIELWQVCIGLIAVSFMAWFEVDSRYAKKARSLKQRKLKDIQAKIHQLSRKRTTHIDEDEIREITNLYDESRNSIDSLNNTTHLFFFSGILFLVSLTTRIAMQYINIELESLETATFASGFIIFLIAWKNCYSLRALVATEEDPSTTTLFTAIIVGIIGGINAYLLWIIIPIIFQGRATFDLMIFAGLLVLSFIGIIIFLAKEKEARWTQGGYFLMILPWLYLLAISIVGYLLRLL
jgi:membrane-associated HD superfamily phosphohydrolase